MTQLTDTCRGPTWVSVTLILLGPLLRGLNALETPERGAQAIGLGRSGG